MHAKKQTCKRFMLIKNKLQVNCHSQKIVDKQTDKGSPIVAIVKTVGLPISKMWGHKY
jgi:hypothetical protein